MAVSEESRHHLYQRLEEVLGREETKVLMEYLPPVGWADVAAKRDLDALETRMGMRFDRVGERFADMDRRLSDMDRRWDERFADMDRRWDERFADIDRRFADMDRRWDERFAQVDSRLERLEGIPREFRSLLYALMSFMAVMVGAMVAAIKI